MRVRFTPSGRSQFLAALAFIRRDDPAAAARFRRRAEIALKRLQRFPGSGRVLPEFPELPYREDTSGANGMMWRLTPACSRRRASGFRRLHPCRLASTAAEPRR